jgi:hypothetical protein
LLTAPVWRYFQLQPSNSANIALGFSSKDPAVVEAQIGRGRSLLFATALSASSVDRAGNTTIPWTGLPAWPSFPPLVHGLLKSSMRGRDSDRTLDVGDPLVVSLRTGDRGATVVLPNQNKERLAVDDLAESRQAIYERVARCGVYRVEIDDETERRSRSYAANLDVRESNIRRVDPKNLPKEFKNAGELSGLADFVLSDAFRQRLFRPLLVTVGILLLVEQFLAVAFARKSA